MHHEIDSLKSAAKQTLTPGLSSGAVHYTQPSTQPATHSARPEQVLMCSSESEIYY